MNLAFQKRVLPPNTSGISDSTPSMDDYTDLITVEPGKRGGRPCIRGMRITVYDILSYLASGMTPQDILDDFPYLTQEDIQACLQYAADRERRSTIPRP